MKTYILEGIVTALSSICHNGGEKNGTVTQLRREKIILPNGKVSEIPVISGNSIRGKLRDIAAIDILTKPSGDKIKVDPDSFNLLFSGGALENTGDEGINLKKVKDMKRDMPMLSVLGGSVGNIIMPGKVSIGKLIPICKETLHIIPEAFHLKDEHLKSVWDICQIEMMTRKDDSKNENLKVFLSDHALKIGSPTQMMFHVETIAAGTKFYWKVCLIDTNDIETGAFLSVIQSWSAQSSQIGGNGRVGHGKIKVEFNNTYTVDSDVEFKNSDFVTYIQLAKENKKDVSDFFESGKSRAIFE